MGASYETPLGDSPLSFFANVNYNWQDEVVFNLFGDPATRQGSYGIFNGSIGLKESENEKWKVTAFVNNLFDQEYSAGIANNANLFGGNVVLYQQLARNYSRYGGIRIKLGF